MWKREKLSEVLSLRRTVARHPDCTTTTHQPAWWRVDYLPIGMFGSVMGLAGLSVGWGLASARFGAPRWISSALGSIAMAAFSAMLVGYALKMVTAPEAVRSEFNHPAAGNLFATFLISLLLLPILIAPGALILARSMWALGSVGTVAFAWWHVSRWMKEPQLTSHVTPAWLVPIVGLLNLPLAVPALGWPAMQGCVVVGLALGLFFAIPLFTLIFARLMFTPPMPDALRPSLLVLAAPFAVGFSSYVTTTGNIDLFARSLYVLTVFMLAVLAPQLAFLRRTCPFRVSWWSAAFPLAASAVAALRFATLCPGEIGDAIAVLLLGVATTVIGGILGQTLWGIVSGKLRALVD